MMRAFLPLVLFGLSTGLFAADETALDRYVRTPDPAYRWNAVATIPGQGWTTYVLDMVSQRWLTPAEVDRPEWRHWIVIVKPDKVDYDTGILLINGGSNDDKAPTGPDPLLTALALEARAVMIDVRMIPNEPLKFADENSGRSEDAIIAYSWKKFMETGDEKWPLRLPMTKAAVRAMDAAQEFLKSEAGGGMELPRFLVAGGSKRGWTTYSTAQVDGRVVGIVPLVFDALNLHQSFTHHWRAYGFWSPAIQDYVDAGLVSWINSDRFWQLAEIEDPYQYRERLALPKFVVASTGDQFFLPDSAQFYFGDLPGEKYLRYLPNTDHGLGSLDLASDLLAWLENQLKGRPKPRFWWTADRASGSIRLRTLDKPTQVLLWQASNPEGRDFRREKIGPAWRSKPVTGENGIYTVTVDQPAAGFSAFFLEVTYPGIRYPLRFTTEIVVTPDLYPFEAPVGDSILNSRIPARWGQATGRGRIQ